MFDPLRRFRYWIASPLLEALTDQQSRDLVCRYQDGFETGMKLGLAAGQLQGQQMLLTHLTDFMAQRREQDQAISPEDLERAKQGLIH